VSSPFVEDVGRKTDAVDTHFGWDRTNGADIRAGGSAYFVVKVNHHRMLQAARESRQWAFHHSTEKKLLKYIKVRIILTSLVAFVVVHVLKYYVCECASTEPRAKGVVNSS
jgi:hypothetical protein